MAPLETALTYMDIFFSGHDLERLYTILDDQVIFEGPFYQFTSAYAYVTSLQADPPVECHYNIRYTFENDTQVNLIYDFIKSGIHTRMSQFLEVNTAGITRILLIFDTGTFT